MGPMGLACRSGGLRLHCARMASTASGGRGVAAPDGAGGAEYWRVCPQLFAAASRLPIGPLARWPSGPVAVGVATALVGTLCMAADTFWSRRWRAGLPVLAFAGLQPLAGGVLLAPVA